MINLNSNEQQLLVAAIDAKAKDQYAKLTNPHLDGKYVESYRKVHEDLVKLHVKISRYSPDTHPVEQVKEVVDCVAAYSVTVVPSVDAGRVGEQEHGHS